MSDDYSPGDARQPYSDIGGPAAKHAQTHDIRHEQLTNPMRPGPLTPASPAMMPNRRSSGRKEPERE